MVFPFPIAHRFGAKPKTEIKILECDRLQEDFDKALSCKLFGLHVVNPAYPAEVLIGEGRVTLGWQNKKERREKCDEALGLARQAALPPHDNLNPRP